MKKLKLILRISIILLILCFSVLLLITHVHSEIRYSKFYDIGYGITIITLLLIYITLSIIDYYHPSDKVMKDFESKLSKTMIYVNNCYDEIKKFIISYNDELLKYHCQINLYRYFIDGNNNIISFNDQPNFEKGTKCIFLAKFQDETLSQDENNEMFFEFIGEIVERGTTIWDNDCFKKFNLNNFKKKIIKGYNEIIKKGFTETCYEFRYYKFSKNYI